MAPKSGLRPAQEIKAIDVRTKRKQLHTLPMSSWHTFTSNAIFYTTAGPAISKCLRANTLNEHGANQHGQIKTKVNGEHLGKALVFLTKNKADSMAMHV